MNNEMQTVCRINLRLATLLLKGARQRRRIADADPGLALVLVSRAR